MFPNWLQTFISRDALNEKYLKISFSQNGEDDFIRSHFWEDILKGLKGTYLDIGCYNETLYSNTKLFSLIGWHGIAIDANPDLKSPWLQARPNDYFINACIVPSGDKQLEKEIIFYRFSDGAMSTASRARAEELLSLGWQLEDYLKVPSISLKDIANQSILYGISSPDLISIDLEMIDYLDELPDFLNELKPRLLCIECITPLTISSLFHSREHTILSASGYKIVNLVGGNIFATPIALV